MIDSYVRAADLPRPTPDQAAAVGAAEGRATLAVLRNLHDEDWQRPTDCTEWDVRTVVSHLVGQCEDGIHLRSSLRRQILGRRRHPDRSGVDAHMAVQVDDHRHENGPELVERFAELWPRAVAARRRTLGPLRRMTIPSGIPIMPRFSIGYLFDVIYNRDLWLHRVDLTRAVGQPFTHHDHERQIVAQVVRDLALGWSAAPVHLELTGAAGGSWLIGSGEPTAHVRADAVAYLRLLSGRDDHVEPDLVSGDPAARDPLRTARVPF